jgi:anti-sigma regulatory factor (Ser/Thr protein kinase)
MSVAEAAKPEMRVFLGSPGQVRHVREFVAETLDACPVADDVALLASEVATNAIVHTASGKGGTFTVVVTTDVGRVRVEVHDDGSEHAPDVREERTPQESGSGLYLVDALATRWGHLGDRNGRVVWFELDWS